MAQVEKSAACLRLHGDDLDPHEITRLLGPAPTEAQRKGDERIIKATGQVVVAKAGMWRLVASDRAPEDLDGQIEEILGQLTSDLTIWRRIGEICQQVDLFCGLFLGATNEGMSLSAKSLVALGERGIRLDLDIYSGSSGEEEADV